jgi:hypothetical protein
MTMPDRIQETKKGAKSSKSEAKKPRRHPLIGWMKGTVTIMSGTDLTAPPDETWGNATSRKADE